MFAELIINSNSWLLNDFSTKGMIDTLLADIEAGERYLTSHVMKHGLVLSFDEAKETSDERITPDYFMEKSRSADEGDLGKRYWVCLMLLLDNGKVVSISLQAHNNKFRFTNGCLMIPASGIGIHSFNPNVDDNSSILLKLKALDL